MECDNNLEKILRGKSLDEFRFFGECEKMDGRVEMFDVAFYTYSNHWELCECKLENPEYGRVDIVPLDYPLHNKMRTYIADVAAMFDRDGTFIRKENESQHVETVYEREYINSVAYIEHLGQVVVGDAEYEK